jgi:hypothetical protein
MGIPIGWNFARDDGNSADAGRNDPEGDQEASQGGRVSTGNVSSRPQQRTDPTLRPGLRNMRNRRRRIGQTRQERDTALRQDVMLGRMPDLLDVLAAVATEDASAPNHSRDTSSNTPLLDMLSRIFDGSFLGSSDSPTITGTPSVIPWPETIYDRQGEPHTLNQPSLVRPEALYGNPHNSDVESVEWSDLVESISFINGSSVWLWHSPGDSEGR